MPGRYGGIMNHALYRPIYRAGRPDAQICRLVWSPLFRRGFSRNGTGADVSHSARAQRSYHRDRTWFLAAGAAAGIASFVYTAWKLKRAIDENKKGKLALDSSTPTETFTTEAGTKRKVVIHDADGREIVPTGNQVVPGFPRTIEVSDPASRTSEPSAGVPVVVSDSSGTEYTLVGLGMRTVSFLGIQVYLVGFYVATSDIARVQNFLVKKVNSVATTLVPSERDALRSALLDPHEGEETWDAILRESGCRSAFRIVPVRDTDFHHLRDGFVRAITARSQADSSSTRDESFASSMRDLKGLFNRGKMPKRKELLLCRDQSGRLTISYDDGQKIGRQVLGTVEDERISRLLWLNYLAGKNVASENARRNIIDGIMEFVERPVGTVAAQVV